MLFVCIFATCTYNSKKYICTLITFDCTLIAHTMSYVKFMYTYVHIYVVDMIYLNFCRHKNGAKDANVSSAIPSIVENNHIFQEYTYKKITPCDICSQILRGKINFLFCYFSRKFMQLNGCFSSEKRSQFLSLYLLKLQSKLESLFIFSFCRIFSILLGI